MHSPGKYPLMMLGYSVGDFTVQQSTLILESDKPEITVTSGLATCLIVLCLGLLFNRDNNSTSGIVMRFTDLIYLQRKICCFYYITVPVIVQLLDAYH